MDTRTVVLRGRIWHGTIYIWTGNDDKEDGWPSDADTVIEQEEN
jgi:hypothetical protein